MTDPAMWSRAKQVATYIVRDWMLLNAAERPMNRLVEEIELELDRSFKAGIRAANHTAPLIRAQVLEEAAQVAAERERRERDNDGEDVYIEACRDIAAAIRALKVS